MAKGTQKAGFLFGQDRDEQFERQPRYLESARERQVKRGCFLTERTPVKIHSAF